LGNNIRFTIREHHCEVSVAACRFIGVYANPHLSPNQLHELLDSIKPHSKSCVVGDFNAHYALWGDKTNQKGKEVARWGTQRNLTQHVPRNRVTWRRGDKWSTLDLIFHTPALTFRPLPQHLTFLASDHCILSGEVTCLRPDTHLYTVTDWNFFTKYAEDPPPYTTQTQGQAYRDLKDLLAQHRITKKAASHI